MANRQLREDRYAAAYRTNGAAAYDVRAFGGAAAPELPRRRLPEERPQPVRRVRVRAKTAISPFAVLGMLVAACMMVLVIFGYVQLYEATSQTGDLEETLESMEQQNQLLRSDYEGRIDLAAVEKRAIRELGMVQPSSSQTVYLELVSDDRAEILQEEEVSKITEAVNALKSSVEGLVSYLS